MIILLSLCSVFESPGHLSIMSQTLRKRGRESEALPVSNEVKRFEGEETDWFLHLLLADEELAEESCFPSEELVSGVMRSLEEEIAATCSTSYLVSNSGDGLAASDFSSDHEGHTLTSEARVDLSYLLDASDDELGIPPSPVLSLKDEFCLSQKEVSEGLSENPDYKPLGENWHYVEDLENYQQFALYEDAWNASDLQGYMNTDFISPGMLLDGEYSQALTIETGDYM